MSAEPVAAQYDRVDARLNLDDTVDLLQDGVPVPGFTGLSGADARQMLHRWAQMRGGVVMHTEQPDGTILQDVFEADGSVFPLRTPAPARRPATADGRPLGLDLHGLDPQARQDWDLEQSAGPRPPRRPRPRPSRAREVLFVLVVLAVVLAAGQVIGMATGHGDLPGLVKDLSRQLSTLLPGHP
ncbi:hypothetical protein V6N00_13000 [Tersicoccus sp. MR15.9]|uniref:hypothetical protein n=1 Tax=Tersicoccus mangrovi TaxID=3121635 RepID=UPI002FE58DEF